MKKHVEGENILNEAKSDLNLLVRDSLVHTVKSNGSIGSQSDRRIGNYLAKIYPDTLGTRTRCKKICKKQKFVFVNDHVVTTSSYIVKEGDVIRVDLGSLRSEEDSVKVVKIKLKVLYEDGHCAVVEKPPGLQTNGVNRLRTLENALSYNLKKSDASSSFSPRPVHRLDLMVGGLLIVAKSWVAAQYLCDQFKDRKVKKRYRAILLGNLAEDEGAVRSKIDNKEALTEFKVVHRTKSIHGGHITTVDLWPKTGRKHQLRKHMARLGHPIIGDKLYHRLSMPEPKIYKSATNDPDRKNLCEGKGLFLRALEVEFLPYSQNNITVGKRKGCGDDGPSNESKRINICIPEPHKFQYYRENELKRYKKLRGED